jgi:MFS family permease
MLSGFGDWRFAFAVSSVGAGIVGLAGAMLMPGLPQRLQTNVLQSVAQDIVAHQRQVEAGLTAVSQYGFVLLYLGVLLLSIVVALPFAHLVATGSDLGLSRADALGLLGTIGLTSIAGRFLIGAVADIAGRRATFLVCAMSLAASMVVWAMAAAPAALHVFAILFGAGYGGFIALLPAFATDHFGGRSAGTVIGLLYTGRSIAVLGGPIAAGSAIEAWGGHGVPIVVAALAGFAGVVLLVLVPRLRGA